MLKMEKTFPDLSIVIIARNEAGNIARSIESVLRAVEHYPQAEIVLVDSASTDETVEIARQYPISIVRLSPEWFLSASAGRYIGMRYTRGDLILCLDGDMELVTGWLDQAVPFIVESPEVAGVTGYRRDIHLHDGQISGEQDQHCDLGGHPVEVEYFGSAALYRRSALEQVGGFNPFIISNEEPELCMRLRYAGYKLMCIPCLMCKNYTLPLRSWEYFVRRFHTNLWLGYGQVPRYHLKTGMLWMIISEQGSYVVYLIGVLVSIIGLLLTLFFGNILFFGTWVFIVGVFLIVCWAKKRSLSEIWTSIVLQSFVAYGAVRGFLITPRSPEEYPTDAEIVQVHYNRGGLALRAGPHELLSLQREASR